MVLNRYACSNPWCFEGWHYTVTCPWRVPRPELSAPVRRVPRPTAEQQQAARRYLERQQRAEAEAAERRRRTVWVPPVNDPEPGAGGHGWLLAFIPVALLLAAVMVALLFV